LELSLFVPVIPDEDEEECGALPQPPLKPKDIMIILKLVFYNEFQQTYCWAG